VLFVSTNGRSLGASKATSLRLAESTRHTFTCLHHVTLHAAGAAHPVLISTQSGSSNRQTCPSASNIYTVPCHQLPIPKGRAGTSWETVRNKCGVNLFHTSPHFHRSSLLPSFLPPSSSHPSFLRPSTTLHWHRRTSRMQSDSNSKNNECQFSPSKSFLFEPQHGYFGRGFFIVKANLKKVAAG
jgi:hypothetical protein